MLLNLPTSLPDKNTDRVGWNKCWEQTLTGLYSPGRQFPPLAQLLGTKTVKLLTSLPDHNVLGLSIALRDICTLQQDMAKIAVERFNYDDFEQKWRDTPFDRREELILEGIFRTCCAGPEMEERREWCPEITLKALQKDSTGGFIDLLKELLPANVDSEIIEPKHLSHPSLEQLLAAEGNSHIEIFIRSCRLERCYFISLTIYNILLAFVSVNHTFHAHCSL